ncbi:MAG: flagellar biosynthesis protein FlhB [Deltaproteobacteria bacterium]|nr:flagellar biosynthesis protein FlhB [Deltaproteobacteria bacterium]
MAEQDKDQEKTEQASPKRREDARKKGQVAKSQEVVSVAILLACLTFFYFSAGAMFGSAANLMKLFLGESGTLRIDVDSMSSITALALTKFLAILLPLFIVVLVAAVLSNFLQIGVIFSTEAIEPKLSKIDPIRGFKRLFSLRALVNLLKSILKIVIVGSVAYITVKGELADLLQLGNWETGGILLYLGATIFKVILRSCWVLLALAALDYLFQRWEYEKGLRMSRQDLKEENKQTEGNPLVKARIRRLQREAARQRMMAQVPKADVVITNPTHIAVALRYDHAGMAAPQVIAKGSGYIAERIREIAREHNIPIVENKPLARLLNKAVQVGDAIPVNLYKAVAEVLAYVYSTKTRGMAG